MNGRQSLYPSTASVPSHNILNYLSSCINSVDLTCRTLESINEHLGQQTNDFGRFSSVLTSKKHFDPVSEREINEAKAHLSAEIAPQLKQLIMKAEEALLRDERKSKSVKAKAAQQNLRLEQLAQLHNIPIHLLIREESGDTASDEKTSTSLREIQRLQRELRNLRAEKVEKQAEMDRLEKDLMREARS